MEVTPRFPVPAHPLYFLELHSSRRLGYVSTSTPQDEPSGASPFNPPATTATATHSWIVSGPPCEPPLFSGLWNEDTDWLHQYDIVNAANCWVDPHNLRHISFYLTGMTKTWFFNYQIDFPDWDVFKEHLRQDFASPAVRASLAKRTLDGRKQLRESYTAYIEDVLSLCQRVNTFMTETKCTICSKA